MAEEISGEGFLNLLDTKITPLSGGDEKITVADQLEKTLAPGAKAETPENSTYESLDRISRDIHNTLTRGTGRDSPMKQATDQELDTMMMDGGTEALRGASKDALDNLAYGETSISSTYDEGGQGVYMAIEAASSDTRARLGLPSNANQGAVHYANNQNANIAGAKAKIALGKSIEGRDMSPPAVIRTVLPPEAKILPTPEAKIAGDTAVARIKSDLSKMDQNDPRVSRATSILNQVEAASIGKESRPLHEAAAGIDAVVVSKDSNEIRLLNRSAAVTSGTKTIDEIRAMYPETQKTRVSGTAANYTESLEDRYKMVVDRLAATRPIKAVSDYSAPGFALNLEDVRKDISNLEDAREQTSNLEEINTVDESSVNPTALTLMKNILAEKAEAEKQAEESLPATKEKIAEEGYLYHFAGRSARESIDKDGLRGFPTIEPTKDTDELRGVATSNRRNGRTYFFLDPNNKNIGLFVNPEKNLDLYRVPVTKELLDSLKVDANIEGEDGVARAVYSEGAIAEKGFKAERISSNVTVNDEGSLIFDLDKPKTPVDLSKLGTKADIKTAVQRAEKISTGQGKGEALASMSYRATGGQAVREISEQIASKPSSTGRMVRAVSQASAAVAAGKSGAMRKLGALTTIFRGK